LNSEQLKAMARLKQVAAEAEKSPIREMLKRMEEGGDILSLAFGEANFDPPGELIQIAVRAMKANKNLYTSTPGIPAVRQALAEFAAKWWGARLNPETNILMTVGAMEAIFLAAQVIVEKGDKVLLPDPGWGVMRTVMMRRGAAVDFYPLVEKDHFMIDPEMIISRMDAKTKLVVLNSPSNPTGAVLSAEGFMMLLKEADKKGIFILSDEVYHNYVYGGRHVSGLSFDGFDNLVCVNSFSKTFAVTGWRLGYAVANPEIIRQMGILKESVSLCSFSIGQWALAEFLPHSENYLMAAQDLCRENMHRVIARLQAIAGIKCTPPSGGFYVFPDLSEIEPSSQKMFTRLLDGGVAVVPGDFFGSSGAGRIRIGFAAHYESVSRAMDRLEEVLRKY
jgi:aspartate/methionine/tyrosine aminotransferase